MAGNGKFTFDFDIADIPMIADAMSLASATALVYGKVGEGSRDRFAELKEMFDAHSPIPGKYRGEGYAWFDACTKAYRANVVEVAFVVPESRRSSFRETEGRVLVIVDGVEFPVTEWIKETTAAEVTLGVIAALESSIEPRTRLLTRVSGRATVEASEDDADAELSEAVAALLSKEIEGLEISAADVREVERGWYSRASEGMSSVKFQAAVPHHLADAVASKEFEAQPPGSVPSL